MSEQKFKITDKRMFTAEGVLRDEYQHLSEADIRPAEEAGAPSSSEDRTPPATPAQVPEAMPEAPSGPPLELPASDESLGGPGFFDLVSLLAEPAAAYLGDAGPGVGEAPEDLEMSRAYIDLLDVLRQKTRGNLSSQESAVLEDVIYRLKTRYVQKRG